jgi:hypothetical protein
MSKDKVQLDALHAVMSTALEGLKTTHKVVLPTGKRGKSEITPQMRVTQWKLEIAAATANGNPPELSLAVVKTFKNSADGIKLLKSRLRYLADILTTQKIEGFAPVILPVDSSGRIVGKDSKVPADSFVIGLTAV